jgi:NADH:ubiquinone oxidoreductase subunit K
MVPVEHLFYLSAFLFCTGLAIVIVKRNAILVLIGIELMLNAANLNLVTFNRVHTANHDGQLFALFVMIVAVCESAVGLAIVLRVYRYYQSAVPDEISQLKD